jgi:hypothetical protein
MTVLFHVLHLTLKALFKPLRQMLFVGLKICVGDTDLLKAEGHTPFVDVVTEVRKIRLSHGFDAESGRAYAQYGAILYNRRILFQICQLPKRLEH